MHHSAPHKNSPTSGSPKGLDDYLKNVMKSTEDIVPYHSSNLFFSFPPSRSMMILKDF